MKKFFSQITLVIVFALALASCAPPAAPAVPTAAPTQPPPPTKAAPTLEPTAPPPAETVPPPTETAPAPTATEAKPPLEHKLVPVNFGADPSIIHDHVSKDTAPEKRAPAGDDFTFGKLERPFTDQMEYLPWLDIIDVSLSRRVDFMYFSLSLAGSPQGAPGEPPSYGFELDVNLDGRGDYLFRTTTVPSGEWGQDGLEIWQDTNDSVGGNNVIVSDPAPNGWEGYDKLLWQGGQEENPDLAWVRLLAGDVPRVEFAILPTLLKPNQIFLWGGFADGFWRDPGRFDYVDRFTHVQAGNAMKDNSNYPLKAFYAYDNTCRAPSAFVANGAEPGVCPEAVPPRQGSGGQGQGWCCKPNPTGGPPICGPC